MNQLPHHRGVGVDPIQYVLDEAPHHLLYGLTAYTHALQRQHPDLQVDVVLLGLQLDLKLLYQRLSVLWVQLGQPHCFDNVLDVSRLFGEADYPLQLFNKLTVGNLQSVAIHELLQVGPSLTDQLLDPFVFMAEVDRQLRTNCHKPVEPTLQNSSAENFAFKALV